MSREMDKIDELEAMINNRMFERGVPYLTDRVRNLAQDILKWHEEYLNETKSTTKEK